MKLADLKALLDRCDDRAVVGRGFAYAHSWRGVYSEVAFEPAFDVTVHSMRAEVALALTATFTAYKGGEFTYDLDTNCHLDMWGNYSDLDWAPVILSIAEARTS